MGFLTNRRTKQAFHVDGSNNTGEIVSPIGTPIHNTKQESKIRLITRITERNSKIRESHDEKMRRQKLERAELEKKEKQRQEQLASVIDEIETRRALLKQAKKNPEILDKLQQANPKGGSLPKNFEKVKTQAQKEFFEKETSKLNEMKSKTEKAIQDSKDIIDMNENEIKRKQEQINELKKTSSNVPEINQQNDKAINELTMQIAEYEKSTEHFEKDIQDNINELKHLNNELEKMKFMSKDSAFGTVGNLPNENRPTLPKGTLEARQRAKESYDERKTGKGTTPIFKEGYQHKRKIRNPITGQTFFTSKIPENKDFGGFDKEGDPVFYEKHKPQEHHEPTEQHEPRESDKESSDQHRYRVIPGLAREE